MRDGTREALALLATIGAAFGFGKLLLALAGRAHRLRLRGGLQVGHHA
jgi:hypothetical protein